MNMETTKPYQILKNKLLPFLYEDESSLFYLLAQKKQNRHKNIRKSITNILSDLKMKVSFFDIVNHLILKEDFSTLTDLIIGEKVASSKKALLEEYDCCLNCKKDTVCCKSLLTLEYPQRVKYLLYLRYVKAKQVLNMLKYVSKASCFTVLLHEPILMKFLANYALVVDVKNELKKEGEIVNHKTLYKGAGKYCPFDDFWEAAKIK